MKGLINKLKYSSNSKLAKKTLLLIGIRISIVVTLAALISYYHISDILYDQIQDSLYKYIVERGEKESIIFTNAERNHDKLKQVFYEHWPKYNKSFNKSKFEQLFVPNDDGTTRLSYDAFDGIERADGTLSKYISGFIGSNAPVDNIQFKNKLLLSYELIDRFAEAWTSDYANLYVSMPENVNLVYWPGIRWGDQANSELDVNTEEWVYVADNKNNPKRESVWTGLYYDQTADRWMVSLVTPVDYKGQHLINIGHDILLNTLIDRVIRDKLAGSYNFIVCEAGRIIAHPEQLDNLQFHLGILYAIETDDKHLINMVDLVSSHSESSGQQSFIIDDEQSDVLLAVTKIQGPDWFFVTVYPKSLMSSTALAIVYIVGVIGTISLVFELLIFFGVMNRHILQPVYSFRRFIKGIENQEYGAIEVLKKHEIYSREDEMGELSNAMVAMATTIQRTEDDLEKQVAKRTSELHEANRNLKQESQVRQETLSLLQTIAKNVSGLTGENYFTTLALFLSNSLDADFVIICRLSNDRETIHSLSATIDKKVIDNITYPVSGTPCEVVINKGPQEFNGNVQEMFPEDRDLFDLKIVSYIGTPLIDRVGHCIGHLAVMKRAAFSNQNKIRLVVDSVSSRASYELERQVHEEIIFRQATTDILTGLSNRSNFIKILQRSILSCERNNQKLAVLFLDLDDFKQVNDLFGHTVGDKVLKLSADCFKSSVRKNDFIARVGGDEFIVLLDTIIDIEEPAVVAKNILHNLSQKAHITDIPLALSCSIGIAIYPDDGTNEDELINNADVAMYLAKKEGKNNSRFFSVLMNRKLENKKQIEFDLRQAIVEKEFFLVYQPIVNLRTKQIKKMEALIRWQHPKNGIIYPDEFINVAELSGYIVPIGYLVLNMACRDFNELKEHYHDLESITVNFSTLQFHDPALLSHIIDIVKQHKLTNQCIELEITESFFINTEDTKIIDTLSQLREYGFKVVLDDFGTGYSSLGYLKQLPIDTLKIDKSFIWDLTVDTQSKSLINSIISLAKNFQLDVIAEGVENSEQESILEQYNCELAQGYYYSKPKSLDELSMV
ncbi:MAG: EAL domain-containing protein [Candidatus Thiodiazotropha sp. (ex Lucinoma borealis)]|nr:EAL domain-containing protein [Candidatus Thiodiazotropha sp. (ex Lucinoma borealis)]